MKIFYGGSMHIIHNSNSFFLISDIPSVKLVIYNLKSSWSCGKWCLLRLHSFIFVATLTLT